MSSLFEFIIYEERLAWGQLLFKIRIINFVEDIVKIKICCRDKKAKLSVFLLYSDWIWKHFLTYLTLEGDIKFRSALFLSNMTIQIIMEFCRGIGTKATLKCSFRKSLFVPSEIRLCSLGTTILFCNFLVAIDKNLWVKAVWQNIPK